MRKLLVIIAALIFLYACGADEPRLSSQDIVDKIPWSGPEKAQYQVKQGNKVIGSAELTLEATGESVTLKQEFEFPDEEITDQISVIADAITLRPIEVERHLNGPEGPRDCEAQYARGVATVEQRTKEDQRTDRIDIPSQSYDGWSDLFVWRTLAFAEGYAVDYTDVLTCTLARPQLLAVGLKVTSQENVTVPAGAFETWRLEIRSGGRTQKAWYSTDASHRLVRYDNGDLVFELVRS